ncbi:hypothetical protein AB6A40_006897 [Gnathostoma spinigerum]|uniref:Uncharacterized protein n=1 Tax=Gnathostoma spinigerum TaxID=75299 RepID=A0ABD6EHV2_9BILA
MGWNWAQTDPNVGYTLTTKNCHIPLVSMLRQLLHYGISDKIASLVAVMLSAIMNGARPMTVGMPGWKKHAGGSGSDSSGGRIAINHYSFVPNQLSDLSGPVIKDVSL